MDCQSVGIAIRYHHLESAIAFFDALSLVPVSSTILQITMRELVKIRPLYKQTAGNQGGVTVRVPPPPIVVEASVFMEQPVIRSSRRLLIDAQNKCKIG